MDRDPTNNECTRDPIFLLQVGRRLWTQIPDGIETDGESMWVEDADDLPDWITPHIKDGAVNETAEFWKACEDAENDHGWPLVYVEWRTESVFLTRDEAERYAKATEYRYEKWRVYCIPCDGELARILKDYEPAIVG